MAQALFDSLKQLKDFSCVGNPEHAQIVEAEEALNLKFAPEYTAIIGEFGAVSFYGHHFTGISPFPGNDVVRVTKEQRAYNPQVPKDYYVIEEALIDGIVIWQDCNGNIYQTQPNQEPFLISKSLNTYISKLVK